MNDLTRTIISDLLFTCQSAEFKENNFNQPHIKVFQVSAKTDKGELEGFSIYNDASPDNFYIVGIEEEVVGRFHFYSMSVYENSQSIFTTKNFYKLDASELNRKELGGMVSDLFSELNFALYQQADFFMYLMEKRNTVPNDEIFKFIDFLTSEMPYRFDSKYDNKIF